MSAVEIDARSSRDPRVVRTVSVRGRPPPPPTLGSASTRSEPVAQLELEAVVAARVVAEPLAVEVDRRPVRVKA